MPLTSLASAEESETGAFSRLSVVLHRWRAMSELTLKEVADEIGISTSTLSRFERGEMPDGETLRKILLWLMA